MFANALKTAVRNLAKRKSTALINIAGLTIGMTVSLLILLFVSNEMTYDRFHEKSENIYRLAASLEVQKRALDIPTMPAPFGPKLQEQFPEVLNSVRIRENGSQIVTIDDKIFEENRIYYADPGLFKIFSIEKIRGESRVFLDAPFTLLLTEDMAEKYFGSTDPIGKTLTFNHQDTYTVVGIVKKMPENSHFKYNMLASLSSLQKLRRDLNSWMGFNYHTYIELKSHTSLEGLEKKYYDLLWANIPGQVKNMGVKLKLFLQPLHSIHLHSHLEGELEPPGNLSYIRILTTIALFILLIACINFMNLSTAQSAQRAKEVGMRKVLGAKRSGLIGQFLGESIILSMISLVVALFLMKLLMPLFNNLISKELSFDLVQNWPISLGFLAITLLAGLIAGTYPAFFLSSFMPLEAMRARFKAGRGHRFFRNGLVSLQYIISIALICSTFIIFNQLHLIKNHDLGFDKERVVVIPMTSPLIRQHEAFKNEILGTAGIISAACSNTVPAGGRSETMFTFEGLGQENKLVLPIMDIDEDYIDTMRMEIVKGRNFSRERPGDDRAMVINETLARQLGWEDPIGKTINMLDVEQTPSQGDPNFKYVPYRVIGVVKDFHFESLHEKIRGHIMRKSGEISRISVRLRPENIAQTIDRLMTVWKGMEQGHPFEFSFLDDTFDALYRSEQRIGKIFVSFTIIAIFIACLGLFGLASFTTEQRTKEIGIRKVLGASISSVIMLLSKEFTRWVLLANLIAWPVAFLAMNTWLKGFAYRIHLDIWIFALSGIIALLIALLTVSSKAVKAALSNPVKSLRYE